MTLAHRPHVGHIVWCDARHCGAVIVPAGRRTIDAAEAAARAASWLPVTIAGETRWVCPLHQTYDDRLGRWVATPLVTR